MVTCGIMFIVGRSHFWLGGRGRGNSGRYEVVGVRVRGLRSGVWPEDRSREGGLVTVVS